MKKQLSRASRMLVNKGNWKEEANQELAAEATETEAKGKQCHFTKVRVTCGYIEEPYMHRDRSS